MTAMLGHWPALAKGAPGRERPPGTAACSAVQSQSGCPASSGSGLAPGIWRPADVWVGGKDIAGSAATIALITAADDAKAGRVQFDLGQAAMSIMLAAAGLGIGSCHSAVGNQDLARQLLGYPAGQTCDLPISLGYPAGRPLAPVSVSDRRPFAEVVYRSRW